MLSRSLMMLLILPIPSLPPPLLPCREIFPGKTAARVPRRHTDHQDHQDQGDVAASAAGRRRHGQEAGAQVPAVPVPGAVAHLQAVHVLPPVVPQAQLPPSPPPDQAPAHGEFSGLIMSILLGGQSLRVRGVPNASVFIFLWIYGAFQGNLGYNERKPRSGATCCKVMVGNYFGLLCNHKLPTCRVATLLAIPAGY